MTPFVHSSMASMPGLGRALPTRKLMRGAATKGACGPEESCWEEQRCSAFKHLWPCCKPLECFMGETPGGGSCTLQSRGVGLIVT